MGWSPHPLAEAAITELVIETDTAGRPWHYQPDTGTYTLLGTEGDIHRYVVAQVGTDKYRHHQGTEVTNIITAQKKPRIQPELTEGKLACQNITLNITDPKNLYQRNTPPKTTSPPTSQSPTHPATGLTGGKPSSTKPGRDCPPTTNSPTNGCYSPNSSEPASPTKSHPKEPCSSTPTTPTPANPPSWRC